MQAQILGEEALYRLSVLRWLGRHPNSCEDEKRFSCFIDLVISIFLGFWSQNLHVRKDLDQVP
jgi:hypothetical protein